MNARAKHAPRPHPELVTEAQLMEWLGYQRRADVEEFLRGQGVPILYGRGGRLCTTLEAINKTVLGEEIRQRLEAIEFE